MSDHDPFEGMLSKDDLWTSVRRAIDIIEAARAYGASQHEKSTNCFAGECDDTCPARKALDKLQALVGDPWKNT